jgi:WhiB family redox-sensing transcriptional regulator
MDYGMTDWRHHAACLDEDPELFFPVSDRGQGTRQVALATAVCARCRVRSECLAYALDDRLEYGIFGGTTVRERRNLARVKADHRPNRSSSTMYMHTFN